MNVNEIRDQDPIDTEEELRQLIGYPSELASRKTIHSIDRHCADFISRSPFLVISSSDRLGRCDASPRGDQPGFVLIQDEHRLIIPERPGNKRIDTLRNILMNPYVGLLFLIPGLGETLRINGRASLMKQAELLEQLAVNGRKPLLAISVEVEECFIHCAKAFIRSGLWEPGSWSDKAALPSASRIIADHADLPGTDAEAIARRLEEGYSQRLY
ncbi:pyridoxamine 5'-phosphate oxidase family protein [Paenibacillus montanisoli]|uniref:Pyridoxamine 5'-phosphate oxidase family protein n=1 Tax=Paenibacillus montanisoli TaxID=2081970 RepID=A0A328TVS7_9BACL|nr:pyridoxamine 5'-phosphate oxidase family protein [Paenibacillus montanisoli]RAP73603.1 pyridoxamine 5'-phosphate oxidase family protein [Paenibacillus montanisoli]